MSSPPAPRPTDPAPARRKTVCAVLVVLLAAGFLVDRLPRRAEPRAAGVQGLATMPVAAPPTSLSSTWFCAGATGTADGPADGTVVVANASHRELTGTVTVVPSQGDPRTVPLTVGPRARAVVRQREILSAPYLAALVEMDGGDVVVEHEVAGPLGLSTAPCASSASDRWYLAEGSTAREDTMLLALYNPFPEDAIVDLSFSTDQGRAVPSDFTGIVVKGGRLAVVNVGDHVRRRNNVATVVAARTGRLVVDRIQLRGGATRGLSLALAAPAPGRQWYFPEGLVADGVGERYHLFNPTATEALVSIELALEEGAAEPFDLTIPPRERLTVVANDEERVPRGVGHAAIVRSLNGVPVVAERSVAAAAPAGRSGTADTLGSPRTGRSWLLAAGGATDALDEWVIVLNPGTVAATVSIQGLAAGQLLPVEGLQELAVAPGRRVAVRLTNHVKREDLALLVRSTAPVVVERGLYRVGAPGLALSSGIPLR
ncbi:MAG: hypothetical protein KY439_05495 [Actinobacteria bacterium]|nr:hypothetical protein [Actinomycetota bacterium]